MAPADASAQLGRSRAQQQPASHQDAHRFPHHQSEQHAKEDCPLQGGGHVIWQFHTRVGEGEERKDHEGDERMQALFKAL